MPQQMDINQLNKAKAAVTLSQELLTQAIEKSSSDQALAQEAIQQVSNEIAQAQTAVSQVQSALQTQQAKQESK